MNGVSFLRCSFTLGIAAAFSIVANPSYAQAINDSAYSIIAILSLFLIIYLLPAIVAFLRGHPNRWLILLINSVFGATVIGWFGCLIWAFNAVHRPSAGTAGGESGLNLFANDERQVRIAGQLDAKVTTSDPVDQLGKLKALLDSGSISPEEYSSLKRRILGV